MSRQDAYWIPPSAIDEARLIQVLAEMVLYFLNASEADTDRKDEKGKVTQQPDPTVEAIICADAVEGKKEKTA